MTASTTEKIVFATCISNVLLSILFFFIFFQGFNDVNSCYIVLLILIYSCTISTFPYFVEGMSKRFMLISIVAQAIALIFAFAGVYRGYGLAGAPHPEWNIALYFSIVTWTTLGYGDYHPPPEIALIAAMQALMGYFYLGLIVTFTASHLDGKNH